MTLNTSRRTSIFQKLVPILGEADADALMAEFPATEYDQLVTRDHLRAELALTRTEMQELRHELRTDMHTLEASLRGEMQAIDANLRTDMQALEASLRGEINGLRTDMQTLEASLRAEMHAGDASVRSEIHDLRVEMHACFARAYILVAGAIGGSLVGGMGLAAAIG